MPEPDLRLLVLMRSHGAENRKNRPVFHDKTVCLASLILAAEQVSPRPQLVFLNDGPVPADRMRLMAAAGEVVQGDFGENRRSYREGLRLASGHPGGADLVWFAEDDYLYAPDAFVRLLEAARSLPEVDYFSLYLGELVDRSATEEAASAPAVTGAASTVAWVPAISTTSSFGVRRDALAQDLALLRLMPWTGGAFDHTTSLTLQGRYPFTARELAEDLLPFGTPPSQWPRALTRGALRTGLGLRALRRPGRRRRMVQPTRDLIAHLEVGAFDPADGWDSLADRIRADAGLR